MRLGFFVMQLAVLARMTLLELWRRRLGLIPIVLAALMALAFVFGPVSIGVNGMPEARSFESVAFGGLGLLGCIVGAIAGAGALSGEMERGTMPLLAVKPLPRWAVVVGKGLGVFVFLLCSFLLWDACLLLMASRSPLIADWGAISATPLLAMLVPCLFAFVALFFSAFLPTTGALAATLFAWLAAHVAPEVALVAQQTHTPWVAFLAAAVTRLLPLQALEALGPHAPFGQALSFDQAFALVAIPAWVAFAIAAFQGRSLA